MQTETQNNPMTMPPVKNGLLPYITVDGALKAAEFYTRAFGAEQAFVVPPDEQGRTMHVHLYINGSSLMLSDAYPEHGHPFKTHQGFSLQLVVDDIDSWWGGRWPQASRWSCRSSGCSGAIATVSYATRSACSGR